MHNRRLEPDNSPPSVSHMLAVRAYTQTRPGRQVSLRSIRGAQFNRFD
jgi:hypothetical protein